MTTLPTTTPMRLPRPAGTGPLALGGPGQPGLAQSNASPMNGADVWRVERPYDGFLKSSWSTRLTGRFVGTTITSSL